MNTVIKKPKCPISTGKIIKLANRILFNIDNNYVNHAERTAILALTLCKDWQPPVQDFSLYNLIMISLFHTIGFFREDITMGYFPFNPKTAFFANDEITQSRYVYSAFYLKYMTPLKDNAECLLNFLDTYDFENPLNTKDCIELYKEIIYLCARVSDFDSRNNGMPLPQDINKIAPNTFNPELAAMFNKKNADGKLQELLKRENYKNNLNAIECELNKNNLYAEDYLKLLIYFFDFKSTVTVKHIINTSCYALYIGTKMNLSEPELETLFTGAVLHDIGKICTPQRILECPGKLSDDDMVIMRNHVNETKTLIEDIIPDQIMQTACRHHEKLNGTGYPQKLTENELTDIDKILTVADITSALADARSYKGEFEKDKIFEILNGMVQKKEISPEATDIIIKDYEPIKEALPSLQAFLTLDYSLVIQNYEDYFTDLYADDLIDAMREEKYLAKLEEL